MREFLGFHESNRILGLGVENPQYNTREILARNVRVMLNVCFSDVAPEGTESRYD